MFCRMMYVELVIVRTSTGMIMTKNTARRNRGTVWLVNHATEKCAAKMIAGRNNGRKTKAIWRPEKIT